MMAKEKHKGILGLKEVRVAQELSFSEQDWETPPAARGLHDPDQQNDPAVYKKICAAQSLEQLMTVFNWLSGHSYFFGRTDGKNSIFTVGPMPTRKEPAELRFKSISAHQAALKFEAFANELSSGKIFNAYRLLSGGGIVASNNVLYRTAELLDHCSALIVGLVQNMKLADAELGIKFGNNDRIVQNLLRAFDKVASTLAITFSKDEEVMSEYKKALRNVGEHIANADHNAALQTWKELDKQGKLPQIYAFDIILLHIIISNFADKSSLVEKKKSLLARIFASNKKSIASFIDDSIVLQKYYTRMGLDLPFLTPVGELSRIDAIAVENATARLRANASQLLKEEGLIQHS